MVTLNELEEQGLVCRAAERSLETITFLLQNFKKDKEIRIYREDELKFYGTPNLQPNLNSYYLFTKPSS